MPMASTTSALRTAASAWVMAHTDEPPESCISLRVANSFTMARVNSTSAPASAIQPSSGCMTKMTAMKRGVQGESRIGNTLGPVMKVRKVER